MHGGNHTRLVMRPAPIDAGLVFVRTEITDRDNRIPVSPKAVTGVRNCTTLSNRSGVEVSTIEHLLAALAASGIDNLIIEIDGKELPALDGSAEPFLKLIEQVGINRQPAPRRYLKVLKSVEVKSGDAFACGQQRVEIVPDVRAFRDRLASARTFARVHEVAALKAAGLSKGGSYDNAVVVDGADILNPGGLRFENEFVAHKATDLLGDLYIAGPILGRVTTCKSGHGLNHDLLTALLQDSENWEYVEVEQVDMDEFPSESLTDTLSETLIA